MTPRAPRTRADLPLRDVAAREPLSRQLVVQAAVSYIDEHGLRDLSMRRLGAELGVEAMSLYRYVDGREELLDGVVEAVVDELSIDPDVPIGPNDGWQAFLQKLAHGVRRIALTHPQVFPLLATRHPAAPWIRPPLRSLRWIEAFLEGLTSRGFTDAGAVAAYRGFSSFLLGHLLLEVSTRGAATAPADEPLAEQEDGDDRHRHDIDLSDYPNLSRLVPDLVEDHAFEEFEESLENLLDRLERYVTA
jgi:AcrR family transcriptional regulator